MQKYNNLKNMAIVHVKKSVYIIYFLYMSKREAKILMTNANFMDKKIYFFSLHIKMDNATYYHRNRDVALNKAKEYYKNN